MVPETDEPIVILLVEDNPGDVRLTIEELKDNKIRNSVHVVSDGIEALAFLRREGSYANAVRPHLVLLDLNLPKKDGREVLAEISEDPDLQGIPVVALTSSDAVVDMYTAYSLGVDAYVTKPLDLAKFMAIVKAIDHFALTVVALPHGS
jgi:chemotaxis family two-component system response regulator Rcp1